MSNVLLTCGCVAIAQHSDTHDGLPVNHPSCPVHLCCSVVESKPDLTGRFAICGYATKRDGSKHTAIPSSYDLAFFVYKGPGSTWAVEKCKCGYLKAAHEPDPAGREYPNARARKGFGTKMNAAGGQLIEDHAFEPIGPAEFDEYYCGCYGWD